MPEPTTPREVIVTWNVEPNVVDGTLDLEFEISPPGDALIDVQRFIPSSRREAARKQGVSEQELDGPTTVVENVPISRGRGSWRDFFCEMGVTYQYCVRAHDFVAPSDSEEKVAALA